MEVAEGEGGVAETGSRRDTEGAGSQPSSGVLGHRGSGSSSCVA